MSAEVDNYLSLAANLLKMTSYFLKFLPLAKYLDAAVMAAIGMVFLKLSFKY